MVSVTSKNNIFFKETETKFKSTDLQSSQVNSKTKNKTMEKIDESKVRTISTEKSINPNKFKFDILNKKTKVVANNEFLENVKKSFPKEVRPAPKPDKLIDLEEIKENNLNSLKKDFPNIYECLKKLSDNSKSDKISIMTILKDELKIPQDSRTKLNFEKKWCNSLMKSLSSVNSQDQKEFIENLKINFNSKIIQNGLNKAKNDNILNEFSGTKKEIFKDFLEIYYTDPVLISGLNDSINLGFASGSIKNMSQTFTFNTDYNNTKSNFGSCQDLQRRVSDIMEESKGFSNLFEISKYKQLGGLHNYIIIKDKETKIEYQVDPWYSQKLEGSINLRSWTH